MFSQLKSILILSAVELYCSEKDSVRSMEVIVRAVSARFNAVIKHLTRSTYVIAEQDVRLNLSRAAVIKLTIQLIQNPGLFS